jgi:hypothetical protein
LVDTTPDEEKHAPRDFQPKDLAPAHHQDAEQDLPADVFSD